MKRVPCPSLNGFLWPEVWNILIGWAWVIVLTEDHLSRLIRVLLKEEGGMDIGQARKCLLQ